MGGNKPRQRPQSSLDARETWGLEPGAEPPCLEAKKLSQSCQNNHHPEMALGNLLTDLYRSHNASPPVTKAKLSELDIDKIPNVDAARTAEQALTDRWYEHRSAMQQCLEHYDNPAAFDFLK
ncbi:hypothetical protein PG999_004490 [Apiospora kogelbergensis]|uniref:Uncharacterized protein n=1 Tax=Apiospora kogelbergensis TaxID=1337665 RepID=A0AAW0QZE3_9PEZI